MRILIALTLLVCIATAFRYSHGHRQEADTAAESEQPAQTSSIPTIDEFCSRYGGDKTQCVDTLWVCNYWNGYSIDLCYSVIKEYERLDA